MSDETPRITLKENGPLIVENVPELTLSDGTKAEAKPMMALCRCGQSENKPFCDGTHKKVGWTE